MRKRLFSLFLVAGLFFLFMPSLVSASSLPNPTSIGIGDYAVFRDVLVEGDQLFFVRYEVNYDPVLEIDAENTFKMAIYDGDALLYSRPLNYYQHNIISIYLDADKALDWGEEYKVRIMGDLSCFDSLVEGVNMVTRTLGPGSYYEGHQLGGYLLTQAGILETDWEVTLLSATDKLNSTGTTYFKEAIPGLLDMCPEIFEVVSYTPPYERENWTHAYEEGMLEQRGERLDAAMTDIGDAAGISKGWVGFGLVVMFYFLFAGIIYAATRSSLAAMLMGFPIFVFSGWLGLVSLTLVAVVIMVMVILFGVLFVLGRLA